MQRGRALRALLLVIGLVIVVPSEGTRAIPLDPDELAEEARAAFDGGDYARAASLLERYLEARPDDLGRGILMGWSLYRSGRFEESRERFATLVARGGDVLGARVGLGYSLLQVERPGEALETFLQVLEVQPAESDARLGAFLAAARTPLSPARADAILSLAQQTLEASGSDRTERRAAWSLHATMTGERERRPNPAVDSSTPLLVHARALEDYLELRNAAGGYDPVFVKGFNLGVALPGRYPAEFPEDVEIYARWLETMASLGANTVRLYTLLPPSFYEALVRHNARPESDPIWLIQGVWTELPPGHDFDDEDFVRGFEEEIARVLDAVHGNLLLAPSPGHASGVYSHDASEHVLAYIIGREWEPFAVSDYNALRPGRKDWQGRYFTVREGNAMERWVAARCDFAAGYEADRYRELHPLTFANWPTLDPLHHPSESSREEEDRWRRHYGIPTAGRLAESAWNNDSAEIDAKRIVPTEAMSAGFFAAYHIYPNYPDFMNLDDSLLDEEGASRRTRYAGYLRRLKEHHGSQPILVAEFGMSTSRGVAHLQPEGWHHGGMDERRQGELVGEMLATIHDEGYAGGVVFSFLDEWFKGTWSVAPLEIPAERRRKWFNAESPEQSYGFLAARPASAAITVDGHAEDWQEIPALASHDAASEGEASWGTLFSLRAASDEGYVYLLLQTAGRGELDWSAQRYLVALDTYDDARGERALPTLSDVEMPSGVEFLIELDGPERSRVSVTLPYEPFERLERGEIASPRDSSGRFVPLFFEANRARFGRDGTRYAAEDWERGKLRLGSLDPAASDFDTRADVSVGDAGAIEMRIPWALLNVTDPSSRRVLHAEGGAWTRESEGFRIYAFALRADGAGVESFDALPSLGTLPPRWTWPPWEEPSYRLELKAGAPLLRDAMNALPDELETPQ